MRCYRHGRVYNVYVNEVHDLIEGCTFKYLVTVNALSFSRIDDEHVVMVCIMHTIDAYILYRKTIRSLY